MTTNEQVLQLLKKKQFGAAKELLVTMNVIDLAAFLSDAETETMLLLFRILPKRLAADTFAFLSGTSQKYIISSFSDAEVSNLLRELFVDDVADLVEEVPANIASKILKNANENTRAAVNQILQYPKDSAGSILTTEYVRFKKSMTVSEALSRIRAKGIKSETIYTCYVTDDNRILEGFVSLKNLVLADGNERIENIYTADCISVNTHDDRESVALLFKKYGFLALPVVDNEKRLVGIITVDDIMDVMEAETTEDFQKMAAVSPSEERYLETSVFTLAKNRIFWLLLLMFTETFTGGIIEHFTEVLEQCVILTAFIPVLMDTGGNSGSQATTLIIRGLATDDLHTKDIAKVIWKEFRIGFFVSVILGGFMFIKNFFISRKDLYVSLTVSLAIILTVIIAKVMGAFLPMIAKKLHLDAATMAPPVLTTIVDTVSLLVYFTFAKIFIPGL